MRSGSLFARAGTSVFAIALRHVPVWVAVWVAVLLSPPAARSQISTQPLTDLKEQVDAANANINKTKSQAEEHAKDAKQNAQAKADEVQRKAELAKQRAEAAEKRAEEKAEALKEKNAEMCGKIVEKGEKDAEAAHRYAPRAGTDATTAPPIRFLTADLGNATKRACALDPNYKSRLDALQSALAVETQRINEESSAKVRDSAQAAAKDTAKDTQNAAQGTAVAAQGAVQSTQQGAAATVESTQQSAQVTLQATQQGVQAAGQSVSDSAQSVQTAAQGGSDSAQKAPGSERSCSGQLAKLERGLQNAKKENLGQDDSARAEVAGLDQQWTDFHTGHCDQYPVFTVRMRNVERQLNSLKTQTGG